MIPHEGKKIDTGNFGAHLRNRGIDLTRQEILITRFDQSLQENDLTLPANCNGFGRIHHFKRTIDSRFPSNPLPIDPALNYLKLPYSDEIKVQVFQNAFCSWRCWYCFVDYNLLSANPKHSEFKSAKDLMQLYNTSSQVPPIIDLSGGQPDLVPEWSLWMANEVARLKLSSKIYLWSDDNLSNDYLWKYLKKSEIKKLVSYQNYGRVGCFKGFDESSFSFNTQAEPDLWIEQFRIMRRLVDTGFDMYGYVTMTAENDSDIEKKVSRFIDLLQEKIHPLFPLRTVPLKIYEYSPTRSRMKEAHYDSLNVQNLAVDCWNNELTKRFTEKEINSRIFEHQLR